MSPQEWDFRWLHSADEGLLRKVVTYEYVRESATLKKAICDYLDLPFLHGTVRDALQEYDFDDDALSDQHLDEVMALCPITPFQFWFLGFPDPYVNVLPSDKLTMVFPLGTRDPFARSEALSDLTHSWQTLRSFETPAEVSQSLPYKSIHVFEINWDDYTDPEILNAFRKWLADYGSRTTPEPNKRGKGWVSPAAPKERLKQLAALRLAGAGLSYREAMVEVDRLRALNAPGNYMLPGYTSQSAFSNAKTAAEKFLKEVEAWFDRTSI